MLGAFPTGRVFKDKLSPHVLARTVRPIESVGAVMEILGLWEKSVLVLIWPVEVRLLSLLVHHGAVAGAHLDLSVILLLQPLLLLFLVPFRGGNR